MQSRVVIAPMWDMINTDGFVQAAEDIYIHQPSADSVCIRWKGECLSDTRNVEVVLYRNGRIRFNYGANSGGVFDPAIGISAGNMRCYFLYNQMFSNITLDNAPSILYTPVAAGTRQIMGSQNPESHIASNALANRLYLFREYAWEKGDVSVLRVKVKGNGNIKMAVYEDNAGQPGNLLRAVNDGRAVSASWDGWNDIPVSPFSVNKWSYYWIGFVTDNAIVCLDDYTPSYRWKAAAYSGYSFPGTLTGLTSSTGGGAYVQGWVVTKPDAPVLLLPAAGGSVSGTSVTFQWNCSAGATGYWLTVRRASDNSIFINKSVGGSLSSIQPGFPNNGTQYRWAVASGNSAGWNASDYIIFTNGPVTKPAAPALTSPAEDGITSGTDVTFQWSASTNATSYWLTVQKVGDGSYLINKAIGNLTSYIVSGFPNDGTLYRWAVAAGNPAGWMSSAWRSFYSGSPAKPAVPLLSYPAADAVISGTSINFQWGASAGATRYWLTVQKVSDGSYIFNTAVGNVTNRNVPSFPNDGTQYRWAVAAGNAAGWTSSAWRAFINGP